LKTLIIESSATGRNALKKVLETWNPQLSVLAVANAKIARSKMALESFHLVVYLEPSFDESCVVFVQDVMQSFPDICLLLLADLSQGVPGASKNTFDKIDPWQSFKSLPWNQFSTDLFTGSDGQKQVETFLVTLNKLLVKAPRASKIPEVVEKGHKGADGSPLVKIEKTAKMEFSTRLVQHFKPEIVVIGSSTGGPDALEKALCRLANVKNLRAPILLVQHMPAGFTSILANRIQKVTNVETTEALDGEAVKSNHIYIAPGDFHMRIVGTKKTARIVLDQGPLICSVRPAVDPLFMSAAQIYGPNCMAYVLTGMGQDGMEGTISIKQTGGTVCIQNRESCVVYGMPGAVEEAGSFDEIADLETIAKYLEIQLT
jgi:chemotaxis response regulator CheB